MTWTANRKFLSTLSRTKVSAPPTMHTRLAETENESCFFSVLIYMMYQFTAHIITHQPIWYLPTKQYRKAPLYFLSLVKLEKHRELSQQRRGILINNNRLNLLPSAYIEISVPMYSCVWFTHKRIPPYCILLGEKNCCIAFLYY